MKKIPLMFAVAAMCVLPANASTLYGNDANGAYFTIDTATGEGTLVGTLTPCAVPGATEIEFDPLSQVAFAQQRDGAFCGGKFDPGTGMSIAPPVTDGASITGMEVIDGVWYASAFDGNNSSAALVTLDPDTGATTSIGLTGVGPLTGIANNGGTTYAVNGGNSGASNLYSVNLATGAATLIGTNNHQLGSLEFGSDGVLYGGGTGQADAGDLFRVNTSTGNATLVGATGFGTGLRNGITGLMLAAPVRAVPALDPKGLAGLCAILAVAGAFALRMK